MKKILQILFFAFLGAAALHTAQAQTYDPLAVQRINDLIAKNGLEATPNAPETWEFATWNDETPKQLIELDLTRRYLEGYVLLAGLTTLQKMNFFECSSFNKLDMSNCTQLKWLRYALDTKSFSSVSERGEAELYLTNCTTLQWLDCSIIGLTKLDLTSCSQLQYLNCWYNRLTILDVRYCPQLQHLYCFQNQLVELDLKEMDKLTEFFGTYQTPSFTLHENETGEYACAISLNNPTFDNSAISYTDGILKSTDRKVEYTDFSVQTNKEGFILSGTMYFIYNVGINAHDKVEMQVFPNPTTGELRITNYEIGITRAEVFDIYGRKQKAESRKQKAENEIVVDMENLSAGVYFVKISSDAGVVVKKVVKQ